ncbi:MAG: glycosyltransferase family 2 protein [Lachnospiraceae bacterium]|nr:glycosyltransferase family 2 protein [Lachnospiraceae bacterium]
MDNEKKIPLISIIMPCRDERNTVGSCIDEVREYLESQGRSYEIIVVDNCSTDGSAREATEHSARVVKEDRPGYGFAIRRGIKEATGDFLIIMDCDLTYDPKDIGPILDLMERDFDMVIGDRFLGTIDKGAMSLLHRIGIHALSFIGRIRYKTDIRDFHCGIRGVKKDTAQSLKFRTGGMEFATEMIEKACRENLKTGQTPANLRKCPKSRKSKLRTFRDGMRHLLFMIKG